MQQVCRVTTPTRLDTPNERRSVARWPPSEKTLHKPSRNVKPITLIDRLCLDATRAPGRRAAARRQPRITSTSRTANAYASESRVFRGTSKEFLDRFSTLTPRRKALDEYVPNRWRNPTRDATPRVTGPQRRPEPRKTRGTPLAKNLVWCPPCTARIICRGRRYRPIGRGEKLQPVSQQFGNRPRTRGTGREP
jgi:hypothetical protein